jgi:uncharacterized protein (TIGR02284 family)
MTDRLQVLDILLDITRKGMRFYEQAAAKTSDRALAATFTRIARAKLALLENLGGAALPEGTGTFTTPGSLSDTFRNFYESIRNRVHAGDEFALEQLADREKRLFDAIQTDALAQGKPLSIRAAAALVLPPLEAAIEALRPIRVETETLEEQPQTAAPKRFNVA